MSTFTAGIADMTRVAGHAGLGPARGVSALSTSTIQKRSIACKPEHVNQIISHSPEAIHHRNGACQLAMLPAMFLVERIGRRPLLLVGSVGMALSMAVLAISPSIASRTDTTAAGIVAATCADWILKLVGRHGQPRRFLEHWPVHLHCLCRAQRRHWARGVAGHVAGRAGRARGRRRQ